MCLQTYKVSISFVATWDDFYLRKKNVNKVINLIVKSTFKIESRLSQTI